MPTTKIQILPHNLIKHFFASFSIYDYLFHFHSLTKNCLNSPLTATYNFSAFLTLDKSRKIIRKKEDQFLAQMIRTIQLEAKQLLTKHPNQKELYKITYTELQKFLELFEARKTQFLYFESSTKEIEKVFKTDEKQKHKNQQMIRKMKKTMDEFHEKLEIVLRKYEEKTHVVLLGRLMMKMSRKFSDLNQPDQFQNIALIDESNPHENYPRMMGIYKIQSEYTSQNNIDNPSSFKRSVSKKKTKVLNKYGDASVHNQNIQKIKRQILNLQTKYHKMNCKTEVDKVADEPNDMLMRQHGNRTHTLQTCADSDAGNSNTMIKDKETNASSVKYSIRLTKEKKMSKMNSTSFSIFDKKTHHASFILKNASKAGLDRNAVISDELEETQNSMLGQFSRKRSSLFKNIQGSIEGFLPKKTNNSVYRQTNFASEAQQKLHQKRVSTANPRESLRIQNEHNQFILQTYQTEANIEQDFDPKQEIIFDVEEYNEQVIPVDEDKYKIQAEEDENQMELMLNRENEKKGNNRRKGFSKNKITTQSDFESNYTPSAVSIKRKSMMWSDNPKIQKTYNRTSFFRSSGYTPKKSLLKPTKTKFNNINKNVYRRDGKDFSSDAVIDPTNTQQAIKAKGMQRERTKKMRPNEMTVTAKDCKQLYEQLNAQNKIDQMCLNSSYFMAMMRQKYDLRRKSQLQDQQNNNRHGAFSNPGRMIIETENYGDEGVGKWSKSAVENGQVEFMRTAVRKFNELGQKDLGVVTYSWEDGLDCINL